MISNDCPNSLLNKLRQPLDWIWNLIKFCALHQCYLWWLWWQWWQRWRNIWLANYKPFLLQTTLTSLMFRQISHSVPTHLWADRMSNLFQLIIVSINRIGFGFSTRIAYLPKKSLIICLSNISSHMPTPHMLSIILTFSPIFNTTVRLFSLIECFGQSLKLVSLDLQDSIKLSFLWWMAGPLVIIIVIEFTFAITWIKWLQVWFISMQFFTNWVHICDNRLDSNTGFIYNNRK